MNKHVKTQASGTARLRERLDSLLEGIQIIDFNWKYVYINDIMLHQVRMTRQQLVGHTMMEKFPGIEDTEVFQSLKRCMYEREAVGLENKFTFPNGVVKWFDLCIEPAEEGICILSLDITPYKEAVENIRKTKSLYAFLSQINQSIVHYRSEKRLFASACRTAVEQGLFSSAWIGLIDRQNKGIIPQAQFGFPKKTKFPDFVAYESKDIHHRLMRTGQFQIEINGDQTLAMGKGYKMPTLISLPLFNSGKVVAVFDLYSDKEDFVKDEEIKLLQEVSKDLSYALDNAVMSKRQREAEAQLEKSEKRFRALIEKSADMKSMASKDGKLLYGSPSITRVLGYEYEDTDRFNIFDLIHPDDQPYYAAKRSELIKHPGGFFHFEMRLRHKSGNWIWCEGTATNLLHEPGVEAIISNFIDINDKKKAQKQQEFDRNNLFALINNTNDLLWSVDTEMKLITSNRAFDEAMLTFIGHRIRPGQSILHDGLGAEIAKYYGNFYHRAFLGEIFSETVELTGQSDLWWEISFYPIREKDNIIGTACHARNISSLKRYNEELKRTNSELDRFVYSISHDLRAPLTSIRGLLDIINEDTNESSTREHLRLINGQVDRLDIFIKNVLNYAHTNRASLNVSEIDMEFILHKIVNSMKSVEKSDGIEFHIHFETKVPFHSDLQSVCTLLENIVSNAIKFRDPSKQNPYVKISGSSTESGLKLVISDNGVGIPKEFHSKVFEMFFRLPGPTEGSGIGLYISRQIAEKLDGSITLYSEEGTGTTFEIHLKNLHQ
ncbi:PAS domain S-box protein [Flavobacterium sp. MAH-1]|uniref:histidine kinase n=1 Tax=Flavobacterium agri TaxID=2743471 RepID=A0A7Y9C5I3_9FLAO|nr:PAS domain S-box protein [Flavobacterium agri]NUY81016.1 PAS domain S-box protein [Flavobacterium agri]NYA71040.1 PAS domain S-box protein [Flavobacterium agri]